MRVREEKQKKRKRRLCGQDNNKRCGDACGRDGRRGSPADERERGRDKSAKQRQTFNQSVSQRKTKKQDVCVCQQDETPIKWPFIHKKG